MTSEAPIKITPAIQRAADKYEISPALVEHYQRVFDACADWTAMSNRTERNAHSDGYDLARVLHEVGLLDVRRTCVHRGGSFRGYRIEFKQAEVTP